MNNESMVKIMDGISMLHETIVKALIPIEAQEHFRSSHREALLGVRAVLDHSIEKLDEHAIEVVQKRKDVHRPIKITE
ncbi:hypothetical protein GK047_07205 [Paenibacillus sp. SYP-B3998]|uniref:Uncharacterized protein n=1 Tax=Paenibacillus sp. SYP-B3998 TaxID=2678564 RepID=A0A6G3ZUK8_9BACL|nr:hypothetical protein [Paenibacillus sp. SYP-B3998]NEW05805.1 hypothetical protein [Paenibacillus sp. SYP-B3998]